LFYVIKGLCFLDDALAPTDINATIGLSRKYCATPGTATPYMMMKHAYFLDQNWQKTEEVRMNAHGVMLSNRNNQLAVGGSVATAWFGPDSSWLSSQLAYEKIASVKNHTDWNGKMGAHMWNASADMDYWKMHSGWRYDPTVGLQKLVAPQEQDQGFFAISSSLIDSTISYAGTMVYENGANVEYITEDPWVETLAPSIKPNNINRIFELLRGVPRAHENPTHVIDTIKKVVGKAAEWLPTIIKGASFLKGALGQ